MYCYYLDLQITVFAIVCVFSSYSQNRLSSVFTALSPEMRIQKHQLLTRVQRSVNCISNSRMNEVEF